MDKSSKVIVVAVLVAAFFVGFWIGDGRGYTRAEADVKETQQAAAKKAAGDAVEAANPFQAVNPLAGIEVNPFEKTKKILNPFGE